MFRLYINLSVLKRDRNPVKHYPLKQVAQYEVAVNA